MSITYNKLTVRIRLGAVRANYRLLASRSSGEVMPVVKADAYGHGMVPVAEALLQEGARSFAAGTVEESCELAAALPEARVFSLLGPMDRRDADLLAGDEVIPFAGCFDQLALVAEAAARRTRALPLCLKFDTGMSRLGFTLRDVPAIADTLRDNPGLRAVMASSHLACADEPEQFQRVREQGRTFQAVLDALAEAGLRVEANLANSAAILALDELHHHSQRAGIALYGANPYHGTELEHRGRDLVPAMQAAAPVVQVHDLPKDASVSYGATFTAERDMRVAVVAAGYADGYSRGLSNRGEVLLAGRRARILGRVCMQLTVVDATGLEGVHAGSWATLLGGEGPEAVRPEELAEWWGTIPYEVFCLLGLNRKTFGR